MARLPIYLDHHATTPVDPRVLDAMLPYFREDFGNAASTSHAYGFRAEAAVEDARERVGAVLGAPPESIVFTSGATEANNLAIAGSARARKSRNELVTLATEHPAVLDVCRALESDGFPLATIPVEPDGLVDASLIESALTERTALVSVMAANNEIGVLQSLEEIGSICRARGVAFHTDAAQAAGKISLDVEALGVDFLSLSAHKFYGPKGIGALYVRPRSRIVPLMYGGGHERGLRPGTLAVPLCVGMAHALEIAAEEMASEAVRLAALRERLWAHLQSELDDVCRNGHATRRLPGSLNVCFRRVDGDRLLLALPDLAISTGSACSTARPEPSHVLLAIGLDKRDARSSLRFGLGRATTEDQIELAGQRVVEEVRRQRNAA